MELSCRRCGRLSRDPNDYGDWLAVLEAEGGPDYVCPCCLTESEARRLHDYIIDVPREMAADRLEEAPAAEPL